MAQSENAHAGHPIFMGYPPYIVMGLKARRDLFILSCKQRDFPNAGVMEKSLSNFKIWLQKPESNYSQELHHA